MRRWTIKQINETDDLTFAMCIMSERREMLNQEAPLAKKLRSAYHTIDHLRPFVRETPHKTCACCAHASWFEDRSVGLFGNYECDNPELPDGYDDELPGENENADCPFFEPRIIERCANCKREMKVPEWIWSIWHPGEYGNLPCCCHNCASELRRKEHEEYKKRLEDERRYNDENC